MPRAILQTCIFLGGTESGDRLSEKKGKRRRDRRRAKSMRKEKRESGRQKFGAGAHTHAHRAFPARRRRRGGRIKHVKTAVEPAAQVRARSSEPKEGCIPLPPWYPAITAGCETPAQAVLPLPDDKASTGEQEKQSHRRRDLSRCKKKRNHEPSARMSPHPGTAAKLSGRERAVPAGPSLLSPKPTPPLGGPPSFSPRPLLSMIQVKLAV